MSIKKIILYIGIIPFFGLAACATANSKIEGQPANNTTSEAQDAPSKRVNSAAKEIMEQPFRDLGFMKKEIPAALAQIADPYSTPEGMDCTWISYQISQLDIVLPHEAVRSASFDDRSQSEKNAETMAKATDSAMNEVVRGAATSIVPVRGIVRKLSGAEKSDSDYNAALERGKIRRGYLRGLSFAKNCPTR